MKDATIILAFVGFFALSCGLVYIVSTWMFRRYESALRGKRTGGGFNWRTLLNQPGPR